MIRMKGPTQIFFLFLLSALCLPAGALAAGSAAFLELDSGARASAMAGAFSAIADDPSGIFYNPAGPALMPDKEIMFSHSAWLEGLNNDHLAYVHPVRGKFALSAGLATLTGPAMERFDNARNKTGTFSSLGAAAGIGAAMPLPSGCYGGFILKVIYEQADKEKGRAYAGDIGLIKKLTEGWRLGFAAQNIGTRMKLYREAFSLPATYRAGAAYRLAGRHWLSLEVIRTGDGNVGLAAGAEAKARLAAETDGYARAGYVTGRAKNTGPGISVGAGLEYKGLLLDYSFSPYGDLGDSHKASISFKFGSGNSDGSVRLRPAAPPAAGAGDHGTPGPEKKTFFLKDGGRLEGEVLQETVLDLLVKTRYGTLRIKRADISGAGDAAVPAVHAAAAPAVAEAGGAALTFARAAPADGPLAAGKDADGGYALVYYKDGVAVATEAYNAAGPVSVQGSIPDGTYREYYDDGKLRSVRTMFSGKANGAMTGYYRAGQIQATAAYSDGKKDGVFRFYGENGTLVMEAGYKNDLLNGFKKEFGPSGALASETYYLDGRPAEPLAGAAAPPAGERSEEMTGRVVAVSRGELVYVYLAGKYVGRVQLDKNDNVITMTGSIPDGLVKVYSKTGKLLKGIIAEQSSGKARVIKAGGEESGRD